MKREWEGKLRDAAEEGDVEECKRILKKKATTTPIADVNSKNEEGWTALHLATNEGHFAVAAFLLESGADIEGRNKQLKTSLHIACCRGDIRTVKLLVQHKADLAAQDIEGNTCLHTISMYGMNKVMEWLSANTSISLIKHIKNCVGKTAADIAANPDILEMLGMKKAEPKEPCRQQQTKQVHVYHTNQICVNKYMGNMISKPAGDASDEDPGLDSLASSYAEGKEVETETKKAVNVVRGPIDLAEKIKAEGRGKGGCEEEGKMWGVR